VLSCYRYKETGTKGSYIQYWENKVLSMAANALHPMTGLCIQTLCINSGQGQ
jgi:hypothetical protein